MSYTIYALVHPEDKKVRYVGLTKDVDKRYQQHLRKATWIQELKNQGLKPVLSILETVDALEVAKEREQYWIGRYEGLGHALENIVHNEWAIRAREEEAQELAGLQRQYAHLPPAQAKAIIEITKGARSHVGYCAWDDAFDVALDTVKELQKDGLLDPSINEVDIAIITLRRWNLTWKGEEAYRNENV